MSRPRGRALAALSIGALGVVHGDIGTSPLYAFKECVSGPHAVAVTPANVYGILSLIFWALVLVVAVKYLTIHTERVPKVAPRNMAEVSSLGEGIFQVIAHVGFQQDPDVPALLAQCRRHGLRFDPGSTSYFLGRETLLTSGRAPMARWRKKLFAFLSLNSRSPAHFFHLPPNRVVELGAQIQL